MANVEDTHGLADAHAAAAIDGRTGARFGRHKDISDRPRAALKAGSEAPMAMAGDMFRRTARRAA